MATEPLDTLQLKIESDASAAAKGLKELQGALKTLRTSLSRSKALDLGPVADEISKFASAVNSVNTDKIERLADAISTIRESSKGLSASMRSATRAVTAAQQGTSGRSTRPSTPSQGSSAPEDTATSTAATARETQRVTEVSASAQISALQRVNATAKRVFSGIVNVAKTSFRAVTKLVEGLSQAFVKVGEVAKSVLVKSAEIMKTAFITPFKAIGNGLSKIYKTVTGLIRSVARIALYRAIRTAIKAVTQGLNEGIQNLYQWSLLVDRTFANSMDSIATSMQYLHNGFASMFSPLINYAAPIIEEVTNRLVDFFNVVQQIFATLTGASTWTKAVRVQKQYAEAVTDTGKAAEKAMHQVMAFDELNIINSPNDSGSPGSGANTPDYGSMFVTEEVDTGLKSWVEEIKKFFESGDFRGLGTYVGEKLNALVAQWNAYDDGFNFGEKIKHVLEALNGFLETFDFYDFGFKVGNWISGLLDGVTPEEITDAIVNLINSAISGTTGLVDSLLANNVPGKIGQALGTAFARFDWAGLVNLTKKILTGIVNLVNSATSAFIANGGPEQLVSSAEQIGLAIGEALASVEWEDVAKVLSSICLGIVKMVSAAIHNFIDYGGADKLVNACKIIGAAIGESLATVNWKDVAAALGAIFEGLVALFSEAISSFIDLGGPAQLVEACKTLGIAIGNALSTIEWKDVSVALGAILEGVISLFNTAIGSFVANGGPEKIKSGLEDFGTRIGESFATVDWTSVAAVLEGIVTGLGNMFKNAVTSFISEGGFEKAWEGIESLSLPTKLALAVPIIFKLAEGASLAMTIIESILGVGAVTAASANKMFSVTPEGLVITLSLLILPTLKKEGTKTVDDLLNNGNVDITSTFGSRMFANSSIGQAVGKENSSWFWGEGLSYIWGEIKDVLGLDSDDRDDYKIEIENVSGAVKDLKDATDNLSDAVTSGYSDFSWGRNIDGKLNTGGGSGGNTRNYMFNPLKGTLLAGVQKEIEQSDLSSKMEALSQRTGEAAKRGFESTNVPGKYKAIATASLDEFGKTDFTSGGTSSGDEIKTGVERSNIRSKFSEEADKAANAVNGKDFTTVGTGLGDKVKSGLTASNIAGTAATLATNVVNAFGAVKPTAAAMGATLGAVLASNFKAHFIANAKSNLMIQTAAGKPITQAYVVPYANGGYVQGGLFLAGEVAGQSEMVGSINGRTGVASGEEITGIREAVVSTGDEEASLLRQLLTVGQALLMKDPFGTPNSAAGRWIAQSQQAYKAVTG